MSRREIFIPEGHDNGEILTFPQKLMHHVVRTLLEIIARLYFRLEVHGRENIPRKGPFLIAPIHRSYLDTPVIGASIRRLMRYMGAEKMWTNRQLGWFLTAMGGFPVQRGSADREALKAALMVVERGEPLVMFPEGTRQNGSRVSEMFDGPAYVACRTGAVIIPVGIGGTERAMPKGKKFIWPVKMVVVIGAPITPPPKKESGRVSRNGVRQMTLELGERLQELFDEAQFLAGCPNKD
ncbi:MAG: lysophospholipid acyltransferase family protein [Acidimicrobiales bacterium]